MKDVVLVGCGYVADLYMRSFDVMTDMRVTGAHDRDPERLRAFCARWDLRPLPDMDAVKEAGHKGALALNLTNPAAHVAVSRELLDAGLHVWSEKPMTLSMDDARALHALAAAKGVHLASAPSSVLSEAAQALGRALRAGIAGRPVVAYAEMDDGFIPQAPYRLWRSESGAPWPAGDEFRTGATLEHAGYWLSWLIALFGPVRTVVAASAELVPGKEGVEGVPDFSVATLFFHSGMVARLTCSIAAPVDRRLRVVGETGTLTVPEAWDNATRVKFRRRLVLRRRLIESPLARRVVVSANPHPHVAPKGAAAMNFALGPHEMLDAIAAGRTPRLAGDYALHLTEVTLAIHNAGEGAGAQAMSTRCEVMEPMPWAL
ncbi:MAG: Gfo/Idh/MocA family oxidoreductase [Rubellimicrobium sp.]|nr:Gfo/Idh/MocA family oxidoreductase [Rubellimicrobium sp.]